MKKLLGGGMIFVILVAFVSCGGGGGGGSSGSGESSGPAHVCTGSQPAVYLTSAGASQLSGYVCNADASKKIVIYALTNEWYVQPLISAPFTDIGSDGSWTSSTNPWSKLVVLLVDPAKFNPVSTDIINPAFEPGVLAYTMYPAGQASVNFSGYSWGIKMTGSAPTNQFDPGPNFWSNDPSVVSVQADGLHLNVTQIGGIWQCAEVYLLQSLGYGTYTMKVGSDLSQLDPNIVACPLFLYVAPDEEWDNEYNAGVMISSPNNAQFVVQPYTVSGNLYRYVQPAVAQFTIQIEWRANYIVFNSWKGWADAPAPADKIESWTYTGAYIPPPGAERIRMNMWLYNGAAPTNGKSAGMVLNSFNFKP